MTHFHSHGTRTYDLVPMISHVSHMHSYALIHWGVRCEVFASDEHLTGFNFLFAPLVDRYQWPPRFPLLFGKPCKAKSHILSHFWRELRI